MDAAKLLAEFEQVVKGHEGVEGWLEPKQALALFIAAKSVIGTLRPACIVEIGSHYGLSTIFLAGAVKDHGHVIAIDPWLPGGQRFQKFWRNVHGLPVEPFMGTSAQAAAELEFRYIDMLYIDGSHEEEAVQCDFDLWTPRLRVGGILAMHDVHFSKGVDVEGPGQVVIKEIFGNPQWGGFVRIGKSGMFITRKLED